MPPASCARKKNEAGDNRGKKDSVHTTPGRFETGGFTPQIHKMFSVHTTSEEF